MSVDLQSRVFNEFYDALVRLPFVAESGEGFDFWHVSPSGFEDTDLDLGEFYGRLALKAAKDFDAPMLPAVIVRDMIKIGQYGPLESGFIGVLIMAAKAGVMN